VKTRVDTFARTLPAETTKNVRAASVLKTNGRAPALTTALGDYEEARNRAAEIKNDVLDHLGEFLLEFEKNCLANGIHVHWAETADEANAIILSICQKHAEPGAVIAKGKSMVTEEIGLNEHLEAAGYHPIETDLGEFVVQIDHDKPSHIVTPIIHKNRFQVAESFKREQLGDYSEVPEELAMQARAHLREKFREAKIGISGVNFAIAASGRLAIVENEGNNRLSTTVPPVHIAVMGIEKLLPRDEDLALFLPLLAGSATAQPLTTYVHMIQSPRRPDEADGPMEVHLVLVDAGRSAILNGPYRDVLRCIRCAACLNACPVYRQASGHAYGHVYSGPIGAVLAPLLSPEYKDVPFASTLCGLCEEVCPVKIPLPRFLVELRAQFYTPEREMPWNRFEQGATRPSWWRTGLKLLPMAGSVPHPLKSSWGEFRSLPSKQGRDFRRWWNDRS